MGAFDLDDVLTVPLSEDERQRFDIRDGDVLVCEGGEPGRAAVWRAGPTEIKYQKVIHRVRLADGMSPELISLYMRHLANERVLEDHFTGTAIKHLPREVFSRLPVLVPPLPEQRRIVAKLDRLSARSRAARGHLSRTAKLAARAKQAILAAAFRGELTAEWRENAWGASTEADQAASALEAERSKLLESTSARRKVKAAREDHHRIAIVLAVPAEWRTTTLEGVSSPVRLIQYGILKPGPDVPGGSLTSR